MRSGENPEAVRSEIEDTASSDGGQLMAVPDQREIAASRLIRSRLSPSGGR